MYKRQVNDFSTDATKEIIINNQKSVDYPLFLIQNEKSNSPKKRAIELAVKKAKGDLILVTDGDCIVPKEWISSHVKAHQNTKAYFISGAVKLKIKKNSFFDKLQQLEFTSLIGTGAATLNLGYPTMANAANMSFSKKKFIEIGGYRDTGNTPSGDDELLMHKIAKKHPTKVLSLIHI